VGLAHLTAAESGWKAVFAEPEGGESQSRVLGWAVLAGEEGMEDEVVGVVVDPTEPSRIIPAGEAMSPSGGTFVRYRFVPPEPIVVQAPAPAPAPAEPEAASEQLAKSLLKRKR
jgi:hypothetical protein